jgi:hypothetical protein
MTLWVCGVVSPCPCALCSGVVVPFILSLGGDEHDELLRHWLACRQDAMADVTGGAAAGAAGGTAGGTAGGAAGQNGAHSVVATEGAADGAAQAGGIASVADVTALAASLSVAAPLAAAGGSNTGEEAASASEAEDACTPLSAHEMRAQLAALQVCAWPLRLACSHQPRLRGPVPEACVCRIQRHLEANGRRCASLCPRYMTISTHAIDATLDALHAEVLERIERYYALDSHSGEEDRTGSKSVHFEEPLAPLTQPVEGRDSTDGSLEALPLE